MQEQPRSLVRLVMVAAVLGAVTVGVLQAHTGDVRVYRAGGSAVFGGDLYGVRVGGFGFTYPPFAAVLLAPLAHLPFAAMTGVLTAASALASYVVLRRATPPGCESLAAIGTRIVPLVMVQPLIATVAWGQVNLILAALVLHDLLVLRRGVLVGVAAAIKLTPAIFVLYLLVCGRRREARTATITFALATLVGVVAAPEASLRYWTHDVVAGTGVGGFDHTANQSVRGLVERVLGAGIGVPVWLALAGPMIVFGLVLARRVVRDGQEILAAGIVGVTACLVSPVSWTHHWVWCIPCLAALSVPARVWLGAVFVNPIPWGHVVGFGYPIVAVAALCVCWRRYDSPPVGQPRSLVENVSQRRASPP